MLRDLLRRLGVVHDRPVLVFEPLDEGDPIAPDGIPYPVTIGAHLRLRTGDLLPLVALRGERDGQGIVQYDVRTEAGDDRLPITEADYLAGGYSIGFDLVPGRSAMRFGFRIDEGETP